MAASKEPPSVDTIDPRADDLSDDSGPWLLLLNIVSNNERHPRADYSCYHALHYMRCCGLRLVRTQTAYQLRPHIEATGAHGWRNQDAYKAERDVVLQPHADAIKAALKELWTQHEQGPPQVGQPALVTEQQHAYSGEGRR